jgi:hypothetical protein
MEDAMKSRNRRHLVAAVAAVVLAMVPAQAVAQQPAQDNVGVASEHFQRGVKMYQEDDFRGALIEFKRAYELAPNWAVLYNMGQSEYQLRDYVAALHSLEQYVKEGGAQIPPDRRSQVDREIGELRGRVAHVTIASNQESVDVMLDDAPIGKASGTEPVLVGAGRHKLSASKPGFVTASKTVDIAGGDTLTIRLDLAPEAPPAPPPPHDTPSYGLAIAGGVVGVLGIAGGTVFGVLTMNNKSTLDGECNASKVCHGSAQSDIDAYTRNGIVSGVSFGVGAIGLLVGGYSFFHERAKEGSSQASVRPWIAPNGAGVSGVF